MILEEREKIDRIIKSSQKKVWVTFQREGIHCFPAAATDPKLADVSFLAHPHRHMFHFRISIDVFHDDRELEFIQFKIVCLKNVFSFDIIFILITIIIYCLSE